MTTFTTTINRVKTANVNNLEDVVRQVDFTVEGALEGKTFSIGSTMKLDDPDPQTFISFNNLTETQVIAWLDSNTSVMEPLKSHIRFILERQVEESKLQDKTLPWIIPTP
jgi:hypothetical protein